MTSPKSEDEVVNAFLAECERLWPGSTQAARLLQKHDEYLKRRKTFGRSWYEIISEARGDATDGDVE
jgi:hypothetical protein